MENFNPNIFRLYDIRGLYPEEINAKGVYVIARSFILYLKKETGKNNLTVCIGRDTRISSEEFFDAFTVGVIDEGGKVINIGVVTTPMLYFAVSFGGYDGGVNITASHNPNPFNGLKLVREKAIPIGGDSGLGDIKRVAESFEDVSYSSVPPQKDLIEEKNMIDEYTKDVLRLADGDSGSLSGLRVVVDAGNGTSGPIVEGVFKNFTGLDLTPIYFEPDGRFPNHIPDPLLRENLEDIISAIKNGGGKFDLGVAFDGDGDRAVFLDERGEPIRSDLIVALVARIVLRENPSANIAYDIRSSRVVERVIKEAGGRPIMTRVGHTLIKAKMRKDNILFSGELSGHYYWGDGFFYEVPFYVILKVLKEIKDSGMKISELINSLPQGYYHSGEINFEVEDKKGKIKEIEEKFKNGKISHMDGLLIDYKDWWFNVRSSNTEPYLRLVVEADSPEKLEEKVSLLKGIIET